MVWIGHCYDSETNTNYVPYQPAIPIGIGNRLRRDEVEVEQISIETGNEGYRHCVGISLGALVAIILGLLALGACYPFARPPPQP